MRMPGATEHAHSTDMTTASASPQRTEAVARAPFDILHNMEIDSACCSLLAGSPDRRSAGREWTGLCVVEKLKTPRLEEPPIVKARPARVRPISEPFSPNAYLFFVDDGKAGARALCDMRQRAFRCAMRNLLKHFRTIARAGSRNSLCRFGVFPWVATSTVTRIARGLPGVAI
jgi:hypothetical protein